MNTLFWLYKLRLDSQGRAPIMIRITHLDKRCNINTHLKVLPNLWDAKKQRVKGTCDQSKQINNLLVTFQTRILYIYDDLLRSRKSFTVADIQEAYHGKAKSVHCLLEVFKEHNDEIRSQIGIGYSKSTYAKYDSAFRLLSLFLKANLKKPDITLDQIDSGFLSRYEHFLKVERKNNHNSAVKRLQHLKTVLRFARIRGYMDNEPFANYSMRLKTTPRDFLTKEELKQLQEWEPPTERLSAVKDVFVFQCYTGLAHADVLKVSRKHISNGIDGKPWLMLERTKTGTSVQVPLLPVPLMLIEKYKSYAAANLEERLLPVKKNQPMNRALKEIGAAVKLKKVLTTYMGRHTFGTTITLSNGVPIDVVSKMLAHTNLRTTQIYAKVVDQRLSIEMNKLTEKLNRKEEE